MSSALKRKRGPVEVLEALNLKRPKSTRRQPQNSKVAPLAQKAGWEAAFNPPKKINGLAHTNGVNGDNTNSRRESNSPEVVDFEAYIQESQQRIEQNQKKDVKRGDGKVRKVLKKQGSLEIWKISEPIGGRMINVDPVFTPDEKFLIVGNRTTIHVYSTSNSLLARSLKLEIDFSARPDARIITYCLSPTLSNILWVACSDGAIYSVDWTSGSGADQYWGISSTGCIHMTVASMESAARRRDIVFTTEVRKDGGWRITANELAPPNSPVKTDARTIYTSNQRISYLKTAKEGSVIVAASERKVLVGRLRSTEYGTVDKVKYEFFSFESIDLISCLDVRVRNRPGTEELKSSKMRRTPIVDVVVGDVKGTIFVHNDILANLIRSHSGTLPAGISLIPRKLHWHRKAVHSVKWSLDGNYIISGGTETVLVLWQLDTGKQQFLPHMSATIQNVIISPSGSSYGIQLADNSAMILSTAELQPTANIAGIQTCVLESDPSVESQVERLEEEGRTWPLVQQTPAVINPTDPSRLLLGVGQMQEINPNKSLVMSVPFLQTFDLSSAHNLSRQALTRSNITNINIAPSAHRISEPRITRMKISHDGNWLATVDEWIPPLRDLEFLGHQNKDLVAERQRRREVYLKFWQWTKENDKWELVSRIDGPHSSGDIACRILDLAADPSSLRFSTIGEDNIVRTWSTKTRKRDGVAVRGKDGEALRNWSCQHATIIGKPGLLRLFKESESLDDSEPFLGKSAPASGCVAFSEDGSLLAAACGSEDHGLLHLLDPDLGAIRVSHNSLFEGEIAKMEFLGQNLITLSNRILVYDLVLDEMKYGIKLNNVITSLSAEQKQEMMHLAVDRKNESFAVALPARYMAPLAVDLREESLLSRFSELAVFQLDKREPVFKETFSTLITALLPAASSSGYLVLDTAAEIRTILKKGTQAITTRAQSTSALKLDMVPEESTSDLLQLVDDADEAEGVEEIEPPISSETQDDDYAEFPVVTQQQLSEIFDIGPSFALPPLEEMFYHVAGLFSSKPLAQSV